MGGGVVRNGMGCPAYIDFYVDIAELWWSQLFYGLVIPLAMCAIKLVVPKPEEMCGRVISMVNVECRYSHE